MFFIAALLVLTYVPVSFEESQMFQIPLKHSVRKLIDAELEKLDRSRSKSAFKADPVYNLHGMVGQGYYIELAIGQPEQLVNLIHVFVCNWLPE